MNTLHFGQKAKLVKNPVNLNDITQMGGVDSEIEKAYKEEVGLLKAKLKEQEVLINELVIKT